MPASPLGSRDSADSRLWRRRGATTGDAERGSAAVEFALVVPVLVMLLLGIVTGGIVYSRAIALTDAVRESARFGATGDAASVTWAADVIARERSTQIDDSTQTTAVCVQLWKSTGPTTGSAVASACDQGSFGTPALTDSDPAMPAPPTGLTAGTCVVRVVTARKYQIVLAPFPSIDGTMKRGAVARYERSTC